MNVIPIITLALFCLGTEQNYDSNDTMHYNTIRQGVISILHWKENLKSFAPGETCELWIDESDLNLASAGHPNRRLYQFKDEAQDSSMMRKGNDGFLHRWLIPITVTIGAGSIIFAVYSVRGR